MQLSTFKHMSDELQENLNDCPWYFPTLTRKEAETKLFNTGQVGERNNKRVSDILVVSNKWSLLLVGCTCMQTAILRSKDWFSCRVYIFNSYIALFYGIVCLILSGPDWQARQEVQKRYVDQPIQARYPRRFWDSLFIDKISRAIWLA